VVLLLSVATIITNLKEIRNNKIFNSPVVGVGPENSDFSFGELCTQAKSKMIIAGQNLRTLLSNKKNIALIKLLLNRGVDVSFIISTKNALEKIHPLAAKHIDSTIADISDLLLNVENKKKIHIYHNDNTLSLSAIYIDTDDDEIVVFNPKWFFDSEPLNRVYVVARKSTDREVFLKINGAFPIMMQNDSAMNSLGV
jgi:hypothetical protein